VVIGRIAPQQIARRTACSAAQPAITVKLASSVTAE
jgi:hypothetical protein